MKTAAELHENTPKGWYYESIKVDLLQRYWHHRRFKEVGKLIERVKGNVLDIGCADGMFSKVVFDKTGARKLIGVDVVKSSIDWANSHWKNKAMKFEVGNAEQLNHKSNTFEAVFALEMLEHVYKPLRVLKEARRVMQKNGYGVFLVPTDNWLFKVIWFLWLHFYPRGYVWKETHIRTYKKNDLLYLCKKAGFKVEKDVRFLVGMLQAIKVRK